MNMTDIEKITNKEAKYMEKVYERRMPRVWAVEFEKI